MDFVEAVAVTSVEVVVATFVADEEVKFIN